MESGLIKCIFFSEFHTTTGPRIVYQVPEDYIKKEDFDIVHVFVITKAELRNNIITVNAVGHKIVGCPVKIDGTGKYARNELLFNLCFVFNADSNTEKYEGIVKKLAAYFTTLEIESEFLSKEENSQRLQQILHQLLQQLNQGQCSIYIDPSTTINLKVISDKPAPIQVADHDVPILNRSKPFTTTVKQLDLSTQQLLCYIDGFKHVAKIAAEADVDIAIVKACVQNLAYHGVMKIISTFQYGNVYVVTPDINKLYEDSRLQEECAKFVARPGKLPSFKDILTLYCGLKSGTTVKDLCARYGANLRVIDEKKLIQFGLLHGLIRRLNKYPIKLVNEQGSVRLRMLYNWFDGVHSCDEICCKTGLNCQELEEKIDNDPSVVVCWK